MAFDDAELRLGIVDLFEEGATRSEYTTSFEEWSSFQIERRARPEPELTRESIARMPLPRLPVYVPPPPPKLRLRRPPVRRTGPRRRDGSPIHVSHSGCYICISCNSRSPTHRCPG